MSTSGKTYATLNGNVLWNIITTPFRDENGEIRRNVDGSEVTFEQSYSYHYENNMYVEITGMDPMPGENWTYDGEKFTPPYTPPILTIEEQREEGRKVYLNAIGLGAAQYILMSLNLDDATDEASMKVKEWQAYYRAIRDVDVTAADFVWPVTPVTSF